VFVNLGMVVGLLLAIGKNARSSGARSYWCFIQPRG